MKLGLLRYFLVTVSANCKWENLNLHSLSTIEPIKCVYGNYSLSYTSCRNGLVCQELPAMTVAYNIPNNACIAATSKWDNGIIQPETNSTYTKFTFNYTNGMNGSGCSNGRNTEIIFKCDANDSVPYINDKTICGEKPQQNGVCLYWIVIYTQFACGNTSNQSKISNDISLGSIFILIFVVCFVMYCIVGYIMNGFKSHGKYDTFCSEKNIPNYNFWKSFPQLVYNGCLVSFKCICKKSGMFKFQMYGIKGKKDTFGSELTLSTWNIFPNFK
eukprot:286575_1